ncbi:methyltransferase [Neptunomonas antarctica]|uniref:16S rRNA m(2)G 1207 methyltransferase n=1 Tax=Neptunomonas antarctica TaxID=619304 RepID=A0A1N7PLV0_9GAMM|nr:methyltransferase [Neptunomonas antarctica]SIT11369.1 16S rRNA m(2)G 1207 methyltransferase [Neptunomonas antarctica]
MSTDKAFDLLHYEFKQASAPALWIVDENIAADTIPTAVPLICAIANRLDVAENLQHKGWDCCFDDYLLEAIPEHHFQSIFLRIPKEKAQAHYIINQAQRLLVAGGSLYLTGLKQEGIKGFIERAATLAKKPAQTWKADKQTWAGKITFTGISESLLDDKAYRDLRQSPQDEHFSFWSKPGIFGWDKIDRGSELLIQHLKELVKNHGAINSVLDIGCGYGYLSVHTARLLNARITATDNNAAAITACQANLDHHQIDGEVSADNCAQKITPRFPLVVCNPPFHSGFGVENDLTDRFLASAAQHLNRDGVAIFVTNLHIPLERKASRYFSLCDTPVVTDHFKLVRLSQPK